MNPRSEAAVEQSNDLGLVECGVCGMQLPPDSTRCTECGATPAEINRWRTRDRARWIWLAAELRAPLVWLRRYFLLVLLIGAALLLLATVVGRAMPSWLGDAIGSSIRLAFLAGTVAVAVRADVALRQLPSWGIARTRMEGWLPGCAGAVLGLLVPGFFSGAFGQTGAFGPVSDMLQFALGALAAASAASTASATRRMCAMLTLVGPTAGSSTQPPANGLRRLLGWLGGTGPLRSLRSPKRVWLTWGTCVMAVTLLPGAFNYLLLSASDSRYGGPIPGAWEYLHNAAWVSIWVGFILWVRRALDARARLRRWLRE